jgi:hypothetical protein
MGARSRRAWFTGRKRADVIEAPAFSTLKAMVKLRRGAILWRLAVRPSAAKAWYRCGVNEPRKGMAMSSLRNLIVSTVLVAGTLAVAPAEAAITLVPFSPTAFSTNEAAMNAALGITSYQIEDFEDTELLGSLSYRLGGPAAGTFGALPAVFSVSADLAFTNNAWDGSRVLLGNAGNAFPEEVARASSVEFLIAGGARSFGVGLSNFQSLSAPRLQFPSNDHRLEINGVDFGSLEALAGWVPGRTLHNLYLRIDASGSDTINSVSFSNAANGVDLLVFDHVAIQAAPVPVPPALFSFLTGLCLLSYRALRRS